MESSESTSHADPSIEHALDFFCEHLRAGGHIREGQKVWLTVSTAKVANFTALRLLSGQSELTLSEIEQDEQLYQEAIKTSDESVDLAEVSRCNLVEYHGRARTNTEIEKRILVSSLIENPFATEMEYRLGYFMTITTLGGGPTDFWVVLRTGDESVVPAAVVELDTDD